MQFAAGSWKGAYVGTGGEKDDCSLVVNDSTVDQQKIIIGAQQGNFFGNDDAIKEKRECNKAIVIMGRTSRYVICIVSLS
jgi:hypothetical protein